MEYLDIVQTFATRKLSEILIYIYFSEYGLPDLRDGLRDCASRAIEKHLKDPCPSLRHGFQKYALLKESLDHSRVGPNTWGWRKEQG